MIGARSKGKIIKYPILNAQSPIPCFPNLISQFQSQP
ncbi:hypothetical protein B6N60_01324 [Richelia sinica FACHB-800]|uniref:Uncharacterized protein n=1 Tax=Richelia sinica FACHB-800 TaxID=1357546 RepID=A0A975T5R8_9NOST|nr:hypothetical protein B6N60_01324 [Richelia sinica FACHB-800]